MAAIPSITPTLQSNKVISTNHFVLATTKFALLQANITTAPKSRVTSDFRRLALTNFMRTAVLLKPNKPTLSGLEHQMEIHQGSEISTPLIPTHDP